VPQPLFSEEFPVIELHLVWGWVVVVGGAVCMRLRFEGQRGREIQVCE